MFNIADTIVLLILFCVIYSAYRKGILETFFKLGSNIISIIAAGLLSPHIGALLRKTPLNGFLKQRIASTLGLEEMIVQQSQKVQADLINGLELPEFLKTMIFENNNPEMHNILDTSGIVDYISGFIASLVINAISVLVIYLLIWVGLALIRRSLKIFTRVPVIETVNKVLGAVLGLIQGTLIIWVLLAVISLFCARPEYQYVLDTITNSLIAKKFYKTDIFIYLISQIV